MDHRLSPDSTSASSIFHDSCQPRRSSRGSPSFLPHSPPSPSSLPRLRSERGFSLQNRRLQLRNAGFRGARISPRKVSDHLSTWRSLSGSSESESEKENQQVSATEGDDSRERGSVRRKVNVLQEIHNSSCRRQQSPRPSVNALFCNSPEDTSHACFLSRPPSPGFPSSILSSPSYSSDEGDTESLMRSREQSPPGSSPLPSHCQLGQRKRDSRMRKPSYETTRYIEHLETQLAAAQSQLSPMQSSSARPQVSKLRALNAELKVLKQEIAEWESKFDARLREEIGERTQVEAKLRTRIRVLEGQIELDSCRITELEYEKEIQAQKLRDAESLKSTNRSLERRVDVLTELLAQSPTRPETPWSPVRGSDAMSPTRSPGPRLSRPRSMVPSIPLRRRDSLFQPLVGTDADGHHSHSPLHELAMELDTGKPVQSVSQPLQANIIPETDSRDSLFDTSTVSSSSKSQRSSAFSQFSSVSSQWSFPFPFSPDFHGKMHVRPRTMRRFPSGTCTLKPLILPTATAQALNYLPQQSLSSHLEPSPAFDPAMEFVDDGIDDGPEEETGDTVYSMVQQDTLAALEGYTSYYKTFDEAILEYGEGLPYSIKAENSGSNDGYSTLRRNARTDNDGSSLTRFFATEAADILPNPGMESTQAHSCSSSTTDSINGLGSALSTRRTKVQNHNWGSDKTPKAGAMSPNVNQISSPGIIGQAREILFGFCGQFKGFQSCFSVLARRIIASVWKTGVRRFGKLSWWILGMLIGSQTRRAWFKTTPPVLKADTYERHRYSGGLEGARSGDGLLSVHKDCGAPSTSTRPKLRREQLAICSDSTDSHTHGNSLSHTLCLWAKFSIALVVAVGLAFRHGPGSLLEGEPPLRAKKDPDRAYSSEADSPPSSVRKTALPSRVDNRERCCEDDSKTSSSCGTSEPELVWTRTLTVEDFLTG
jgi:hypothetical protein